MNFRLTSSKNNEENQFFFRFFEEMGSIDREVIFEVLLSEMAAIIDENRRVVFASEGLLKMLNAQADQSFYRMKPGDLFGCTHACETSEGCGSTAACRYCGTHTVVNRCLTEGVKLESECRIIRKSDNGQPAYDLVVRATPLVLETRRFVVLSVEDISDKKRRNLLEVTFLNESLDQIRLLIQKLELLVDSRADQMSETLTYINTTAYDIQESFHSWHTLALAERGEFIPTFRRFVSLSLLQDLVERFSHTPSQQGQHIMVYPFSHSILMEADTDILKQTLIHLIKNAIESTTPDTTIQLGAWLKNKYVRFWVHNEGMMAEEVKQQIFQRSFSTKGAHRGVGTYTVKLFAEKCLHGKAGFSTEESGTTFWVEIPLSPGMLLKT
ncbi:MAG: HAMP domain-containing histidine kinase [Lentimicrobium sp.]|jgi:hypothetical protein|nr:HAMP domain-containing histidine kinase [Lentimicrobium sp.]MDY0024807.1 HAMP domain-containing sensor histidine kinase [Lentimicrobium sp.]